MSYNLFLDDIRAPHDVATYIMPYSIKHYYNLKWVIVRNYPEFVKIVEEKGLPELVSFDHDLAEGHYHASFMDKDNVQYEDYRQFEDDYNKTGYHCAKWMINYCIENNKKFPEYIVHSMNPVGKENITSLIKSFINVRQRDI